MERAKTKSEIQSSIQDHLLLSKQLYEFEGIISEIAAAIVLSLKNNGKILWMGNGGSAADCQHLAAEFVGRFEEDREGLPAIALTTDTSILTSVSNDYGFESVFKRQVEALCKKGDIVIGISTSGKSLNVVNALRKADELGAIPIGFTGKVSIPLDNIAKFCLKIPSANTARIQEMHILCGHIICEIVEKTIFET